MKPESAYFSVWTIRWSNPNKPRPEGFPLVMLQVRRPIAKGEGAGKCPAEIHECWEEMQPYGYACFWHQDAPPARRLPEETKQRVRRRNLWKRLLAKTPMFVEDFYTEQVLARPDNYGPLVPGEFADVVFALTTMGNLKMVTK